MRPKKPARRRARGTGSIFFHEGKGSWVGRVVVGRLPSGKPKYRECWGGTQAEVVRKMATAEAPGPDTTVAAWSARWLLTLTTRPQTAASYKGRLEHVLPALGHLRVVAVTSADVEQLAARLVKSLEKSTTSAVLTVASIMFRAAVRARLIAHNPVADARKPKVPRSKKDVYTPDELAKVIAAADWYAGAGGAALLAAVGCRVGEAIALDVGDFDPAAGTLAITKTFVAINGTIGPPKSENGTRTIRVPDVALPVLAAAAGSRKSGPLFRTAKGKRFRPSGIDRSLRFVLRDLKLADNGPHTLRHSVATALVAAQVPVADVAKYLGDSVETIVRTYLHASGADPAVALNRLYGGVRGGSSIAG